MSGSSKRTYSICCSRQPASTSSTVGLCSWLLATKNYLLVPRSVVPQLGIQPEVSRQCNDIRTSAGRHDGEHSAAVAVVALDRRGDDLGRLQVMAFPPFPAKRRIGVADQHE